MQKGTSPQTARPKQGSKPNAGAPKQQQQQPKTPAAAKTSAPPKSLTRPLEPVFKDRTDQTHEKHLLELRALNNNVDVLLLGDSMFERMKSTGAELWKSFNMAQFGTIFNAGVGGDGTQHVLYRIDKKLLAKMKPRLVFIMIGTNNIEKDDAGAIAQATSIIVEKVFEQIGPDCRVVLYGVLPRGKPNEGALRERIKTLNKKLETEVVTKFASAGRTIMYEYFGQEFTQSENGNKIEKLFDDDVHLNRAGYAIWFEKSLIPLIKKHLPPKSTASPAGSSATTTQQ